VLTLGVGSESLVGYSVRVPEGPEYGGYLPGARTELFIHTHVREDALDLYGFATRMEKDLFLTLLEVNGIGPKSAMGVLSKIAPQDLVDAILNKDKSTLTNIPGIGKKTAERLVLELGDKIEKRIAQSRPAGARAGATSGSKSAAKPTGNTAVRDARDALMGLGYKEQDVTLVLEQILEHAETPPSRAEDLIRTALKQI
ncbi:MAG: Holliday junction branch migration protein RuvA, partial [Bdellovibrionota bacterium]